MTIMFLRFPAGIYIFVVGITTNVNQAELNEIATDPDEMNVFMARDFSALGDVRTNLKRAMCNGMWRQIIWYIYVMCTYMTINFETSTVHVFIFTHG